MNRPYKIAVFIDQLLPGGVQKAAIEEVKNLNKLGIDTKLVILMRKGFEKAYEYLVINTPYEFLSDRYPFFLRKSFSELFHILTENYFLVFFFFEDSCQVISNFCKTNTLLKRKLLQKTRKKYPQDKGCLLLCPHCQKCNRFSLLSKEKLQK